MFICKCSMHVIFTLHEVDLKIKCDGNLSLFKVIVIFL